MKNPLLFINKNNIFLIFLFIILVIPLSINAQGWEKTYSLDNKSRPNSIIQTMDGGYLTLNYNYTGSVALLMDISLRKLSANGEEEWDKIFEGLYRTDLGGIMETPNGDIVVVASRKKSAINNSLQMDIFKLDNNGTEIWQKSIINPLCTSANSILFSNDGNYIIGGTLRESIDNMPAKSNFLLIKLSPEGEIFWEQSYSNDDYPMSAYEVSQTQDNGYILTGHGIDAFWIKTDSVGVEEWKNSYGYATYNYARDIYQMGDGSYRLFCSFQNIEPAPNYRKFVMLQLNEMGEIQQEITIDSTSSFYPPQQKVRKTGDGNFIVLSTTPTTASSGNNYHLYKLDPDGNVLWENEYGQNHFAYGYDFQITSDGGFIMTGIISSTNIGGDVYIVKTDENGMFTSNIFELDEKENVNIYPNPTNGIFFIDQKSPQTNNLQVSIYDITGKVILTSPKQRIYNNQLEFNLSSFTDGVYVVKITFDDSVLVKQLVLQKF